MTRPVFRVISGASREAARSEQKSAVRRHCQTMAGDTGSPVARSQTTVVSRWLVMPIPAIAAYYYTDAPRLSDEFTDGFEERLAAYVRTRARERRS